MNASGNQLDMLLKIAAADLVNKDWELAHSIDTSNTVISKKTVRRVQRKIKNYDRAVRWNEVPVVCRRIVAAVLIICTLSWGVCMGIQPIRAEILSIIMGWYDKFVAVFYVTEEIPPSVIEEYREPRLQLMGTEKQIVMQNKYDYIIMYLIDGEQCMLYQQMVISDGVTNLDSENCEISEINIHDNIAQLFTYEDGVRTITWHDNEYSYIMFIEQNEIDLDILISIAESIQ